MTSTSKIGRFLWICLTQDLQYLMQNQSQQNPLLVTLISYQLHLMITTSHCCLLIIQHNFVTRSHQLSKIKQKINKKNKIKIKKLKNKIKIKTLKKRTTSTLYILYQGGDY